MADRKKKRKEKKWLTDPDQESVISAKAVERLFLN